MPESADDKLKRMLGVAAKVAAKRIRLKDAVATSGFPSRSLARAVLVVRKGGDTELLAAVRNGRVTVSNAATFLEKHGDMDAVDRHNALVRFLDGWHRTLSAAAEFVRNDASGGKRKEEGRKVTDTLFDPARAARKDPDVAALEARVAKLERFVLGLKKMMAKDLVD